MNVLIPVKSFKKAKSRLSAHLSPEEREKFARFCFSNVIHCLKSCPEIKKISIMTNGNNVARKATKEGLHVIMDPPDKNTLGEKLKAVIETEYQFLDQKLIILMSDLPFLRKEEVQVLVNECENHEVTLALDSHQKGTNALGLTLPLAIPLYFGDKESGKLHLQNAKQEKRSLKVISELKGITFDVDTIEDYHNLSSSFVRDN
jgi:2-phospho-L-lactate guanylyltransferase